VAALIRKEEQGNDNLDLAPESSSALRDQPSLVVATDVNSVVLQNLDRNVALNEASEYCKVAGLDFNDQAMLGPSSGWIDTEGFHHPPVDLILAADIICQPEDAYGVARLIRNCIGFGGEAVVVCADSSARFGVDHFVTACQEQGLRVSVTDVNELYAATLSRNLELTSGFVAGMNMNMFRVHL
jgi:predicted nicotinamide N-methyase